ncbi:hypothetical protein ACFLX8_03990 [Chloroflexota bacterium]
MLLTSLIILLIAGAALLLDATLMITKRPNPIKDWPLPCPLTLILLGVGIILFCIASF